MLSSEIVGIAVNDKGSAYLVRGEFLLISGTDLKLGVNSIAIHYRNKFNNDYHGCINYTETINSVSKQYIYINF